jgi:hypothetical protein
MGFSHLLYYSSIVRFFFTVVEQGFYPMLPVLHRVITTQLNPIKPLRSGEIHSGVLVVEDNLLGHKYLNCSPRVQLLEQRLLILSPLVLFEAASKMVAHLGKLQHS